MIISKAGPQKFWERLRMEADLPDVRLHDLRHSFASFAASAGMSLPMIGKLLGHKSVQTTARYAHLHDDSIRAATNQIGAVIGSAVKGEKIKP